MWVDGPKFKKIGNLLLARKSDYIEDVLTQILPSAESQKASIPATCPTCRVELVRRPLPYLEFFVSACPNQHGAWLSDEVSRKLRDWIVESFSISAQRNTLIRFFQPLMIVVIAAFLAFLVHHLF